MTKFDWEGRDQMQSRHVRVFDGYGSVTASITTKSETPEADGRWITRLRLKFEDTIFASGGLDLASQSMEDDEAIADALEWLAQQVRTCR